MYINMAARRAVNAVAKAQPIPINTTYIYSHGKTTERILNIPNNVIVFMQCNNQIIFADYKYDLAKLIFALSKHEVSCTTATGYVDEFYDIFNNQHSLFCCYLRQCPDVQFTFNDDELNLQIYNSKEHSSYLPILQTAYKVHMKTLEYYTNEVAPKVPWSYTKCIKDKRFLDDEFRPNLRQVNEKDYNIFLESRKLFYKDISGEAIDSPQPISLSDIFQHLEQDKNNFHVVIVNACRQGDPSELNVSKGISLEQFQQYQNLKLRGKHMLINNDFFVDICNKLETFNTTLSGGKRQTTTITKPKKTTKLDTKKNTKKINQEGQKKK